MSLKFMGNKGHWRSKSLFYEHRDGERDHLEPFEPLYSLKTFDVTDPSTGKVYPSLHRLYVEMGDISEYEFANKYLGGWSHWRHLEKSPSMKPYIDAMRDELEIKTKNQAIRVIVNASENGSVVASKFLLKDQWVEPSNPKGRPSKEQVEQRIAEEVNSKRSMLQDLERIQ